MMVDSPSVSFITGFCSEGVHVGVEQDQDEGHQQVEDQPDVNHLHIGCVGQIVAHADKHGRQHKHCCQIDCHNSFEEKILKILFVFTIICFLALKGELQCKSTSKLV